MKFLTFFFIMIFISPVQSGHKISGLDKLFSSEQGNQICQESAGPGLNILIHKLKFIQADEREAFFVFQENRTSKILVVDLQTNKEKVIKFEGILSAIHLKPKKILLLSPRQLIILNRKTGELIQEIHTLPRDFDYGKNSFAVAMAEGRDHLYIAHGLNGVMVFDNITYQFVRQIRPSITQPKPFHRSALTGIAFKSSILYLAYDDVTLVRNSKAFEGIVQYDLAKDQKVQEHIVKQSQEAYYKPRLIINNDELVVSNLDLFFRHKISKLGKTRYLRPFRRIWSYSPGKLIGQGLVKNNAIYGCFSNYEGTIKKASKVEFK